MSVDVFGRKLGGVTTSRGPPGIGYKITSDGQYDAEDKRLCNLATPQQLSDAVNLDTLQRMIKSEVRSIYEVTSRLRAELDDVILKVQILKDEYDEKNKKN